MVLPREPGQGDRSHADGKPGSVSQQLEGLSGPSPGGRPGHRPDIVVQAASLNGDGVQAGCLDYVPGWQHRPTTAGPFVPPFGLASWLPWHGDGGQSALNC